MSDTLETSIPPMDDIAEREARADAAKMTRYFMMFAAPLLIMFVILIGAFAWKLSHPKITPQAVASADKNAEIAQLKMQINSLQNQSAAPAQGQSQAQAQSQAQSSAAPAATPSQPAAPPYYAESGSLAQLAARMDRLEASQKAMARAASAAYAARSLQLASHDGDPFLSELAVAEPTIDDPSLTAALRPFAEKGVPSEVTLAVRFPAYAAKANTAAQTHNGKTGFFDRIAQGLAGLISVRRTDNLDGEGAQAILARAENRLNQGDLHGAVGYLTALSPAAHDAMKPWLDQAQARLLVDDTTRRISERAMSRLGQSVASGPAASDSAAAQQGGLL
jgi:hypothetical protein